MNAAARRVSMQVDSSGAVTRGDRRRRARPGRRDRARRDARRELGAAEGVPQLPLVVLRQVAEPLGHVVLDAALRQPHEDARVPEAEDAPRCSARAGASRPRPHRRLRARVHAGFNVVNVGAVADTASRQYSVGLGVIGLFTTALFVSHAAMQVPMGRLCDRFGARLVGVLGLVVVAVASAVALGWRQAWFAIAMRLVAGFGTAAAFVGGSDYVRAMIGSPVAQGLFGAVSMAGGGLAVGRAAVVGELADAVRRGGARRCGGCGARPDRAARRAATARRGACATVVDRRLLPLGVMHAASFGLSVVLGNWVVTLLHRAGGVSEHDGRHRGRAGALPRLALAAAGRTPDRPDRHRARELRRVGRRDGRAGRRVAVPARRCRSDRRRARGRAFRSRRRSPARLGCGPTRRVRRSASST